MSMGTFTKAYEENNKIRAMMKACWMLICKRWKEMYDLSNPRKNWSEKYEKK